MPRRPDVPCSECGTLMWRGTGSLPQGEARCRPCRGLTPRIATAPCVDCGGKAQGVRCRACYGRDKTVRAPDDTHLVRSHRERSAPGLGPAARFRLLARWKVAHMACAYCPALADTVDHVLPLVRGGTNYEGNLTPACRSCNSSKASRTIMEWRLGRRTPRMRKAIAWPKERYMGVAA